jgi:hypothetical protein
MIGDPALGQVNTPPLPNEGQALASRIAMV